MLEALKLRREEQESIIAKELARGVSYSLRTRAAALEARISNLAYALAGSHQEAIDGLKQAVRFFERAGTIASKHLRLEEIQVGGGERLDLKAVLSEMVDALADPRIALGRVDSAWVQAERHYLEDVFLEVLWNACSFSSRETGRITVTLRTEGSMARVDCVDNGPGIHPDFRPSLFKPFKCYPASRMGLGLSYVARLLKAYGGTIEEIGTWKQGAHFVVRIPLVEGQ
jgi:C4-dicarboxylate-specific signal transduction histidine kinase